MGIINRIKQMVLHASPYHIISTKHCTKLSVDALSAPETVYDHQEHLWTQQGPQWSELGPFIEKMGKYMGEGEDAWVFPKAMELVQSVATDEQAVTLQLIWNNLSRFTTNGFPLCDVEERSYQFSKKLLNYAHILNMTFINLTDPVVHTTTLVAIKELVDQYFCFKYTFIFPTIEDKPFEENYFEKVAKHIDSVWKEMLLDPTKPTNPSTFSNQEIHKFTVSPFLMLTSEFKPPYRITQQTSLTEEMAYNAETVYMEICNMSPNIDKVHVIATQFSCFFVCKFIAFWEEYGQSLHWISQRDFRQKWFLFEWDQKRWNNYHSSIFGQVVLLQPELPPLWWPQQLFKQQPYWYQFSKEELPVPPGCLTLVFPDHQIGDNVPLNVHDKQIINSNGGWNEITSIIESHCLSNL